ncbi:DUF1501 domain-containing protein [Humisphaera borealis]|uniref:DUF1501 domain-containing protein n=1 Tax=Humisphaera borealis TaxID=2807512 RepID=A0A7M2X4K4_9BACT|nr:DUF1501 domain-containing protein [Humisphaera borealis]QOV92549.1 DUF1501 domain-containing protein [Humisphaera borealis]
MSLSNPNRRDFLKTASAATLSALAAGAPQLHAADAAEEKIKPTADTVIVLWMAGGMAHTDTFDPKKYTPFAKGIDPKGVLSTFPAIDTAVDHIKLSQGFEKIAKVMDRATLIRSATVADLGLILHSRHQYHWHTGYVPPQTVAAPHIGAMMAKTLGPRDPAMPAFINIGQRLDLGEGEELKSFTTAGFLGSEYGPFNVPLPQEAATAVRPPAGMTPERFDQRNALFRKLAEESPVNRYGSAYQRDSLRRAMDNAYRLLSSPAAKAFDLSLEPKESLAKYLPPGVDPSKPADLAGAGRFGLGCLLARRLVEAGARFIEVTTEYIPFLNWDTHDNGHTRLKKMKEMIDSPIAQLVLDLEQRGLLDRTLIVLASEFSRDMIIEGADAAKPLTRGSPVPPAKLEDIKAYGMHRHFTQAGSVLMFGGGMKKGYVYGATADERPCKAIKNPVTVEDLHATIYRAMGISPKLAYITEERPFYVTKDGKGKPVMDLFA